MVNLEDNNICDWGEIDDFRRLPNIKELKLNKNPIKSVYYKQGWNVLGSLSLEDCLIDDWKSIDEISEFPMVKHLRLQNNPIVMGEERSRELVVART